MVAKLPMTKVIGATEVRNNFGSLLNRVHRGKEQLVVEKLGIAVAAIISIKDYEQYRRLLAQEYHKELGPELGATTQAQSQIEEQSIANSEEDRQAVYEEMHGEKGA